MAETVTEQAATTSPERKRGSAWSPDGLFYPCTEEREAPLTGAAVRLMFYLYQALRTLLYPRREDVYVAADQFIFYEPHNPNVRVAPDIWVCYGVPKEPERDNFRIWEEGAVPSFVVEISSKLSRAGDRGKKLPLYRDVLRCREYLIYDEQRAEILFYRLEAGAYRLVPPEPDGRFYSREVDAWFGKDPELLMRVYDPAGVSLLWVEEFHAEARRFAQLHRETERRRAEEALELERERQRADVEHQRADALAAELERVRAELQRLQERGSQDDDVTVRNEPDNPASL
jgi:Uma2 family endonuclease